MTTPSSRVLCARASDNRRRPECGAPASDSFCAWEGTTLVLNILGRPRAKRDAIGKVKGGQLTVSVTALPVAGRATDHMVDFLAKEFGVSGDDIEVVFGRFNVNKQLRIHAPTIVPPAIANHPLFREITESSPSLFCPDGWGAPG